MPAESRFTRLLTAWIVSSALLAAPQSPRYRMTGRVSNLAPGHHATIYAHGPTNRSAVTRSDGTWEINNATPGVYSVTVTRQGYSFTPTDRTADVRTRDAHDLNFTARPSDQASTGQATSERRSMTGRIYGLRAGHHATVHVHGPTNSAASTRSDGTWEIKNLPAGVYSVSVTRSGYTFTPVDRSIDLRLRDAHGVNFTGRQQ